MGKNQKEKKAVVKLNKAFYSREAIEETIKDYSEVCSAKIEEKNAFLITLEPKEDINLQELCDEFCNYALSMMKI
jgi:hypothetical protein